MFGDSRFGNNGASNVTAQVMQPHQSKVLCRNENVRTGLIGGNPADHPATAIHKSAHVFSSTNARNRCAFVSTCYQ
jgi:hypothetical protein